MPGSTDADANANADAAIVINYSINVSVYVSGSTQSTSAAAAAEAAAAAAAARDRHTGLMQIVQHRYDMRGHDNGACLVAVVVGLIKNLFGPKVHGKN